MADSLDRKENPVLAANIFSRMFFRWMNEFFREGNKRDLEIQDLYCVLPSDNSESLGNQLSLHWNNELAKSVESKKNSPNKSTKYSPSLRKAIAKQFLRKYMLIGVFAFIEECVIRIVQPLCLGYLIRYFATAEFSLLEGWLAAIGVAGSAFLFILTHHPYFFGVQRVGSQIRIACCSLIYRKALRLSQSSLTQTTIGQMVNLLSNDVNRFDQSTVFIHYLWVAPIQTAIVTIILWQFFGPPCLVGVVILLLFIPFQGLMGRLFSKLRVLTAEKTDRRIRVMHEFLNGMRVIKMFAWEIPFSRLVEDSRKNEVKVIRKTNHLRAVNMGIFFVSSKIIIFLTLLVYVAGGEVLTAEKVFVTLCLFNNIRLTVTLFMPFAISQSAEALVSIKRLQDFLLLEERVTLDSNPTKHSDIKPGEVRLENFNAKWNTQYEENTLTDINLTVKPGQLVAVIGHVGSGKSSLLQSILHELPPSSGQVRINSSIGYSAQEPWIFAGSVKENILFGKEMDVDWYHKVIEACALQKDLSLLPYGDNTLLGEKGASLSGGQKARLALCRAVFANADVYLLDDPLSAVDAEVGRHIFEKCINGILKTKTRILVTHQLQLLQHVSHIVLMSNGRIQAEGTFGQLIGSGIDVASLLKNDAEEDASASVSQSETPSKAGLRKLVRNRTMSESSVNSSYGIRRVESVALGESTLLGHMCSHEEIYQDAVEMFPESEELGSSAIEKNGKVNEDVEFLPKSSEESRATGTVPLQVYWKYFRAGSNYCTLLILILTSLVAQILFTGSDYWLNIWTKAEEAKSIETGLEVSTSLEPNSTELNNTSKPEQISTYFAQWGWIRRDYISVYCIIVVAFSIFSMVRTLLFFKICMDASVGLHNGSFQGIMRAPIRFFEINPLGRVLNRFSKDLGFVDDALPVCFFDASVIFLSVIGIIILIGFVNPILLLPALVLAVIFYYLRVYYLKATRSVKRLEGVVRSPVFSHLSSSLYGLTTIRAYGVQSEFIHQFDRHQDLHSSAWFLFIASSRWLGIRLDLISVIFITIVTFSFMFTSQSGSGPEVGLAVSSVLVLTGMFQWGVRQSAEVSNQMVSVERILEYSTLTPEASLESDHRKKPPNGWPAAGEIRMKNMSIHYGNDPPVLHDISLCIKSCEKVGIVGRTGAGKSSIITALFRLVEPDGEIIIDDINVLHIGLHDLRSKISIIPQDPVLFTGTLRENLDPFHEYSDFEIWKVLQQVHLAESVKEMPVGLESEIAEGGSNFSVGERQLMCLGRAILRKNKILVLDEATASVDPKTDALIQTTIREMFEDCTVLTIAHRLNTVMDSDRILVLDAGRVKEFDTPLRLLQNTNGVLYRLAQETGSSSAENLMRIAKEASRKPNSKNGYQDRDDPYSQAVDLQRT